MAERPRDKTICLYATDFSETSQVLHLLTRTSGVVHLLAKGSRRAKSTTGGRIDLLSEGETVYIPPRGEKLATLTEYTERSNHSELRKDYQRLNAALYMLECVRMVMAEGDPSTQIFDLLSAAIGRLDRPDAPVQAVLAYFLWRLLKHIGLLGDMGHCLNCGAVPDPAESYFSSRDGGLLCKGCHSSWSEKRRLDLQVYAALNALLRMERRLPAKLETPQAKAVFDLLNYHLCWQLGKTPKTLRYITP